jgi:hypothetical protein
VISAAVHSSLLERLVERHAYPKAGIPKTKPFLNAEAEQANPYVLDILLELILPKDRHDRRTSRQLRKAFCSFSQSVFSSNPLEIRILLGLQFDSAPVSHLPVLLPAPKYQAQFQLDPMP